MNRKLKSALLTTTGLLLLSRAAAALDVSYPANDPWLKFHILPVGESVTVGEGTFKSQYVMNQTEVSAFEKGTEFWNTYLRSVSVPGSPIPIVVAPIDENDDNAAAVSTPIPAGQQYAGMTELSASVLYGYRNYRYTGGYAALIMVDRPETPGLSWGTDPILTLPKNDMKLSLPSIIAHELFHALGVYSTAEYDDIGDPYPEEKGYGLSKFGDTLSTWDTLLRDVNHRRPDETNKIIVTKADETSDDCTTNGPCFVTLGDGSGPGDNRPNAAVWSGEFPTHGGVYLTGDNILDVLRSGVGDDIAGVVKIRVPTDGPELYVPGLPVNTWEKDYNDDDNPLRGIHYNAELSHIELQNSLMSHQNYRNWGTFMEAELALLQDLGYDLDRRNFYGFSFYRDNMEGENDSPFYARENGQYIVGKPNTSPWGIGFHLYGSGNTLTQTADLLADGFSGIGVRVDGSGNTLNVDPSVRITANGEYGHGILFSYGKEQSLVLRGNVEATGDHGKAVAFDFGDNMLSNRTEYRGSYIRASFDGDDWEKEGLLPELTGALITVADITGSVTGSEAAVYIGPSAYVENINIMKGASINGDIVSDWKPVTNQAMITHANPDTLRTTLTFGDTPGEDGIHTGNADATFNATVKGNISGRESLDMVLTGGKLTVTGNIDVHSLETADDTVLSLTVSGTAKARPVVRADSIDIGGALTYTFDPTLYGLNAGDVLTILNAEDAIDWLETDETFSLESIFDYYKFEYSYNQEAGTLGLKVTSAQSKAAGAQSSNAMTTSVISAVGNKIMGRLNAGSSIGGGRSFVKGQSGGDTFKETGMWGKALYTHAHNSGNNPFKADIVGGVIGLDGKVSDSTTLGIAVAYSKTNGKAGRTEADAETYAGYLYGKIEGKNGWSYNLAAGYGSSRFDVDNTPKFDVKFANAQAYADYDFGKGFVAEGGVRYVFARQDEYTVGATTFKAKDTNTLTGVLGGRYVYESGRFGMQANLAAVYDFISDEATVRATSRGTSMFVNGGRLHRVGGEAGVAATYRTKTWEFELGYDAQIRKDYNDQTVSLKAGYRF